MLAVYQADGSQAVRLTAGQDGGRLLTFNGKGEATVMLSADDVGAGLADVLDGKRGIAVELGVEKGTGTLQALTIEQVERGAE